MNYSDYTHTDMLMEHVTRLEDWLDVSISEAKSLVAKEDARDQLQSWYHEHFLYLALTFQGRSFTEYISTGFDRKQIKDVIMHSVNSIFGHKLRTQYHLTKEGHQILEEAEVKILKRFNQEYNNLLDRVQLRIKRTPDIGYYLRGISADDLVRQFPRNYEERGSGAMVIRVIKQEIKVGHIIKIDNMSEFHRSLVAEFGSVIPKNVQQMARELKNGGCYGK